jgi:ribosomal protein S30
MLVIHSLLRLLSILTKANKAIKMTPRIPPKNASVFAPGNVIRLEFPAQVFFI